MVPVSLTSDIPATVTAIIYQLELIQRRLLRADGLSNLEREMLLGTVAEMLVMVHKLNEQVAPYLELHDMTPR